MTVNGVLKFTSGANNTYILTTDASGNATWISVAGSLGSVTTDNLTQGATNKYYNGADVDARADSRIDFQKGAVNGLATLDAGGKVPSSQIPALVISNTYIVADQAALLGLSANVGDVAVQTDINKTFILRATPASDLANWIQITTPAQVVSFNGRTGVIASQAGDYTAGDVGLGTASVPTFSGLTLSGLTPGSITFASSSGLIAQDNLNLFWDRGNARLGIKTDIPAYALDVNGDIKAGNGALMLLGIKTDPDPAGANGAMYYNASTDRFRCFENSSWKDCDTTGGTTSLQSAYNSGATITTAGSTDINFTLTSGNFNVSGAHAVNFTPTGASSFTSGGALTLTAGAASTWGTTAGSLHINSAASSTWSTIAGNLNLQAAGSGTTANIQIGAGGTGSATPDLLGLDIKSNSGDPSGYNGAIYYNSNSGRFRCYENGSWKDCDTTGGTANLQTIYNNGATITTAASIDLALTLTSGNFTASGAGAVNLTPTAASSFTSGGALTFTGGAASTWGTTAGNLNIDSAAILNLGTANATGISLGKTGTVTTINGSLAIPNYIDFTPISTPAYSEGRIFYDSTDKSLAYFNDVSTSEVHIGQEYVLRVYNQTGSVVSKGEIVYVAGVFNDVPTINLAKADIEATSRAMGIASNDIAVNSYGFVTIRGLVDELDTSSFSNGDALYLSPVTAGSLTSVRPAEPNFSIPIGYVVKSDPMAGIILAEIVSRPWPGSYTPGGVSFASANTYLTSDNTNLFWNNTTKRLGIGDSTPAATLTVGNGTPGSSLFEVFGANGNITTAGDMVLADGGSISTTNSGALNLKAPNVQIGSGAGSATPDLLVADIKNTAGDPTGTAGAMYYNSNSNKFRCYENSSWKDCDAGVVASLQTAYYNGSVITTASSTNINFTLASGNFTASGAGAVDLTPTAASSFTSGGALTLTGGAASTWGTTAGNLTLQAGSGTISLGTSTDLSTAAGLTITSGSNNITLQAAGTGTGDVQIGSGAGSATPDLLVADIKNNAGDPSGTAGAMYYNSNSGRFRCYENGSWKDCDTTGGTATLQTSYNSGATITTAASTDLALTLTSGNFTATGAGAVNLTPTAASSFISGGALTLTGGAASIWGTTAGNLNLQAAGTGTTSNILIGVGGSGSGTPDLFGLDVKSTSGDPSGYNGAMYYNNNSGKFRCYEASGWKDCDTGVGAGSLTLQQGYTNGATITTASSTDLSVILTSGNFTATGAGAVNLTPTSASSFTSGGALTLTGGAASTWGTAAGNLNLQAAGAGTTANVQIGSGAGSATPDLLVADIKTTAGDPSGINGAIYYNADVNKFRCFENNAWANCGSAPLPTSLQAAYGYGATITTASSTDLSVVLTSGNFTATGAGAVNFTPTSASSFISGGALTLDSAAVLNLGTSNATGISLGRSGTITTLNGSMTVPNYLDFTSASNPVYAEGRLFYDNEEKSLAYYSGVAGQTLNIGQENWVQVKNMTGSTILNGRAVYINGTDISGIPTIALAQANDLITSQVIGIATNDIATGAVGYVTSSGSIHDLDTSSFSGGDVLYLSPATPGMFTSIMPSLPNYAEILGYVAKSDSTTGIVLAKIADSKAGKITAGAIAFGEPTYGLISQDNTNLFWNNTTKRLGIGDNTPGATLTVGNGTPGSSLLEIFGATGNIMTQGDINLTSSGGSITAVGGALNLSGTASSTFLTSAGNIILQPADVSTTANVQIGAGGSGSATPDLLVSDIKNTSGDPTGTAGAMYYNSNSGRFRCFENGSWKDCDTTGGTVNLQSAYNSGATITTASSTNINFTLASGNFTASGAGAVNLTPTAASSFISGGALTLTGGAASTLSTTAGALTLTSAATSTWNTTAGSLNLQAAGTGTTANVQIGTGGAGSVTPDLFVLDAKSSAGDPVGVNGAMYYSLTLNEFRCYENDVWMDCDGQGYLHSLQTAYNSGAVITTVGSTDIAYTLTSGNFTASGAGSVNLTPTSASSFTSGGALTLTGGAASTWGTTAGNLSLQAAGTGTTANIQIGLGGAGSVTPDLLVADIKNTAGDPTGTAGATYYNSSTNKFRCFENGSWKDCDTAGNLQTAYNGGASITTSGSNNIAFTLTSGNFNVSGAGAVNLTPTAASSLTSGDALTLTAGATSTWATTLGALNIDAAAALNLGTANAIGISVGKSGITTTNNGALNVTQTLTASNGLTLTTGTLNLTATAGALSLSGLSASSINTGSNALTINTIGVAAGGLTFAGAASITSGAATSMALDSGTTGALNIGTSANAKTITIGNAASTAVKIGTLGTQYGVLYTSSADGILAQTAAGTAGQLLKSNGTSAPTWIDGGTMMMSGNSSNVAVNNTTLYFPITGGVTGNATDSQAGTRNLVSRGGVLKNLRVILSAAIGGGKTGSVTVMKNGVAATLAVTLDTVSTGFSDLVNSVSVAAGDEISIRVTTTGNVKFSWAADFTY